MARKFYFTTDKEKLNIQRIHGYICNLSYWGRGRTIEEVEKTIEHSLCFGLYDASNEQMGFARLVTDYLLFGYIMDFIVFEEFQGKGYGKKFLEFIMDHQVVSKLKTVALKTKDAHDLYEKFGFQRISDSDLWMSIDKLKLI